MAKSANVTGSSAEQACEAASAKAPPVAPVAVAKASKASAKRETAKKKKPGMAAVARKPAPIATVQPAAAVAAEPAPEPIVEPVAAPAAETIAVPDAKPIPTVTQLKEKIMATAKTTDFIKPFTEAVTELQSKAKAAYEKGTAVSGEVTEFSKGNVEALVESTKVLAAGVQDMGKVYVEEAKSAYETFTADLKEMAALKSPAELFQLQGKIARRNFDLLVAQGSKTGDEVMKLCTDAFSPISGRVSLAVEKFSKAA